MRLAPALFDIRTAPLIDHVSGVVRLLKGSKIRRTRRYIRDRWVRCSAKTILHLASHRARAFEWLGSIVRRSNDWIDPLIAMMVGGLLGPLILALFVVDFDIIRSPVGATHAAGRYPRSGRTAGL